MKHHPSIYIARQLLALLVVAASVPSLPALAAPVVLATAPLVTSSTSSVAPNIMYMLDDSGSMDWDYMPDTAKSFAGTVNKSTGVYTGDYGFNSAQCNGVAYNPTITYTPPVYSDGTSYPNASFTAAYNDGYDNTSGTTNLSTSYPGGSGTGASGSLLPTNQAAFYYVYKGTQTQPYQQNYYDPNSTFYKECVSSFGTVPGTSVGSTPGVSVFTFVQVSATSGPGSKDERTNFANWFSYYSTRMMMMKTGVGQAFKGVNPSYRIGFMTMNNNVSPDFVDILPFVGGCAIGSGTCQRDKWYTKLYTANPGQSTPLRQTLSQIGNLYANQYHDTYTYTATVSFTCSGSCTSTSVSSIKVGGVELMNATSAGNTKATNVGSNVSGQINAQSTANPAIYYTATAKNGVVTITGDKPDFSPTALTPVVTVASGNMTVKVTAFVANLQVAMLNGVVPKDPIQYSCQKNFVVLSTDGYWNGNAGYQLDGTTAIGNQDGNADRPYYDGATVNQTTSQVAQTQSQMGKGTSQILQPHETSTSNLVKTSYDLQKSSYPLISSSYDLQKSSYPLISSSYDLQQTSYPLIKTSNPLQQTTYPLIKTSNPLQQTTYPLIKTSNPLQQTTYPLIKTSNPLQQTTWQLQKSTNGGTTWTNTAACTVKTSTTTTCRYAAAPASVTTVTSCNYVVKSSGAVNNTIYNAAVDCAYTTAGQTVTNPAASCTVVNSTASPYSGPQILCSYGAAASPTTVTSCSTVLKSTGSTDTTVYAAAADCAYTTTGQTVTNPAASCSVVNSTASPYSGPQILCSYGAAAAPTTVTSCNVVAKSTGSTNGTAYAAATDCAYTTTGQTVTNPAGSCTVVNSTASPYSGPQVLCSYASAALPTAVTSCSTVAKSAGSTNGTAYAAAADCAYSTTPTVTNPAASCKVVTASASSPYSGPAVSCSYDTAAVSSVTSCTTSAKTTATTNGTTYNASAVTCAYATTPTVTNPAASCKVVTASASSPYSGPAVSCSYDTAAVSTVTSCTTSAKTTATTNGTTYNASAVTCAYATTPTVTNPATCTVAAQSAGPTNYTGPAVSCSWTAWTPYTATTSCIPVPQSGTYNMTATAGVATQCLTDTPVSTCAGGTTCTTGTTGGTTNYVTSTSDNFNCTPVLPTALNNWTTTSCYPQNLFGPAYVASCTAAQASSSNGYVLTTCNTTSNTVNNVTYCNPQIPTAANNYTKITCSASSGGTSDTLADTAMYYYQTDLRTPALGNCTGILGGSTDVCENNVPVSGTDTNTAQHLTTFSLGIGTRGNMVYSSTYKSDTSGDYYSVANGVKADSTKTPPVCSWQSNGSTCNWPAPTGNQTNIDDLWHAAVNGRGQYFNATDPASLASGLQSTLQAINQVTGAAAAAATSTLNPVTGNNYAYVASYTTVKWIGNLEQRTIDVTNGNVSSTASWCVENIAPPTCIAPNFIVTDNSGSSTVYYCAEAAIDFNNDGAVDALDCTSSQVFDSASTTCRTPINNTCMGTLPPMVGATSDTRTIYTANSGGTALTPFDTSYATANPANFSAAHISGLSQWSSLSSAQQTAAAGVNLIKYLRGQYGYEENRTSNPPANWLYRDRIAVLGDALESQPTYIGTPTFSYSDPGYSDFVTAHTGRSGTVYMGTNDGMLHAFAASNGVERWAFVPTQVIPNMWKLADFNYGAQHVNFINGSPIVSDICTANCGNASTAVWKTIIVGGLNAGGREYYALDITDPVNPKLLWEFTPAVAPNLGYSYGRPVVTKKQDGTWVVLVSSGYDNGTLSADNATANSPAGDGMGHLYVLNAGTGSIISNISNAVGSATTPSGFAKFNAYSTVAGTNQAGLVYGGDLLGNVWRFDINTAATPFRFATLADPSGVAQPITVAPTLGAVNGTDIIFVGTGKYLETADLSNHQVQTIYGLVDNNATVTLTNPAGSSRNSNTLIKQTLSSVSSSVRTDTSNPVDLSAFRGWYVDLPDSGERANVDFQLVQGTLLVPTIVPSNTACSPGGYGYFNFFDYKTGGPPGADNKVSEYYSSPIVGMNVLYIGGNPMVEIVTANNPTPTPPPAQPTFKEATGGFTQTREVWRELMP